MNEVVLAYAGAWSAWQDEDSFPFSPDHCINGARIAVNALGSLGVKAKPVSVQFTLFNRFAWDLYTQGIPVTEWPHHAHSIGVGPGKLKKAGGWDGHLMTEGDGWTLDVSARQLHRPGRITVTEPLLLDTVLDAKVLWHVDSHGQTWLIDRWPSNNGWRQAPGWLKPQGPIVREICRRTLRLLETERNT